jgi:uncharacterized membrane protein YfcA
MMQLLPSVFLLAFGCEFVDASLGMGYGTTFTPLLLYLGFSPLQIVPSILLSQFLTGTVAAVAHHGLGNVDLQPSGPHFRVALVLEVSPTFVQVYVGAVVLAMGIAILASLRRRREMSFSWRRVAGLGLLAAFNKGLSGGGYGPLVTSGQMLAGLHPKEAIAICSLAEGITSLAGVLTYALAADGVDWLLAPSMVAGAVLSAPLAALAVSRVSGRRVTAAIGGLTSLLGTAVLLGLLR